jgi:DNA repair protein RecO (recombination protein O)
VERVSVPAVALAVANTAGKSRLLTFLTRNHGKVRLFTRQPTRLNPPKTFIEAVQGGELSYLSPCDNEPGRLVAFVPQRVWPGIREDFTRIVQALAFIEVVNVCATEAEPQPLLFDLLLRFLDHIERDERPETIRLVCTLQLLRIAGFAPHLDTCLACDREIAPTGRALLSAEEGGMVCPSCAPGRRERLLPVTPAALGFMVRALGLPETHLRRLRANAATVGEVSRLLNAFVEFRVDSRLHAGAFLDAMRGR